MDERRSTRPGPASRATAGLLDGEERLPAAQVPLCKALSAMLNAVEIRLSGPLSSHGDRSMALRTLVAATAVTVLTAGTAVSAHLPAPLVPTALVEDVKGAATPVEFMDYVGNGQVIKLEASDVLVLSYLKSCEHETITGGTVTVGTERSDVRDGQVVRAKVPCNGGKIQLSSQQASKSAASAFRLQNADIQPRLYGRTPVVQLPKLGSEERTLLIERVDRKGERHELKIDDTIAAAGFYDLAQVNLNLTRGAVYDASIGSHKMMFQIDAKAKSGPAPVVSRLLRLQ
jgi:hypothetical protein